MHPDLRRYSADGASSALDPVEFAEAESVPETAPGVKGSHSSIFAVGSKTSGQGVSEGRGTVTAAPERSELPQSASAVRPTKKELTSAIFKFVHQEHGTLLIRRLKKREGKMLVNFHIRLTRPDGHEVVHKHFMFVCNEDETRGNKSTFGYVNIEFPEEIRGKGISYAYHYAAASTAKDLGVDYFSVDAAQKEAMIAACTGMKMRSDYEDENYECTPSEMMESTEEKISEKKWEMVA